MAVRVLLVEDDERLAGHVTEYLTSEGFQVMVAHDGTTGRQRWQTDRPDLVILDWMLPGLNGLDLCREIRGAGSTPVIMLTARSDEVDKLLGLEVGADDYLTKPFSLRELLARVRAVLRRAGPADAAPAPDLLRFGDLVVDLAGHAVRHGGHEINLTSTEFKLLAALAQRPGRVFTRMQLVEIAIDEYFEGYERTLDTHISRLRHKLEPATAGHRLIQTVHGVGYKLVPPGE